MAEDNLLLRILGLYKKIESIPPHPETLARDISAYVAKAKIGYKEWYGRNIEKARGRSLHSAAYIVDLKEIADKQLKQANNALGIYFEMKKQDGFEETEIMWRSIAQAKDEFHEIQRISPAVHDHSHLSELHRGKDYELRNPPEFVPNAGDLSQAVANNRSAPSS